MKPHTAGPWKINEHAEIQEVATGIILGKVYMGGHFPCEDEELNANAELIAAAPDLLKALEGMIESWDVLMNEVLPDGVAKEMVKGSFLSEPQKARTAIAKAKGL